MRRLLKEFYNATYVTSGLEREASEVDTGIRDMITYMQKKFQELLENVMGCSLCSCDLGPMVQVHIPGISLPTGIW